MILCVKWRWWIRMGWGKLGGQGVGGGGWSRLWAAIQQTRQNSHLLGVAVIQETGLHTVRNSELDSCNCMLVRVLDLLTCNAFVFVAIFTAFFSFFLPKLHKTFSPFENSVQHYCPCPLYEFYFLPPDITVMYHRISLEPPIRNVIRWKSTWYLRSGFFFNPCNMLAVSAPLVASRVVLRDIALQRYTRMQEN